MKAMGTEIGTIHFVGIGGIGMSGIAEVMHILGYKVQGSDQADSANVQRLRDKGIACFVGHKAENLGKAEVVVVLPWVPATATVDCIRISSASISARRTSGRRRSIAASTSGLPRDTAVEQTTTRASPRLSAPCPMATGIPALRSPSTT